MEVSRIVLARVERGERLSRAVRARRVTHCEPVLAPALASVTTAAAGDTSLRRCLASESGESFSSSPPTDRIRFLVRRALIAPGTTSLIAVHWHG